MPLALLMKKADLSLLPKETLHIILYGLLMAHIRNQKHSS